METQKCSFRTRSQYKPNEALVKYLHILHGHDVHAALGPSLHALGAERVHDNDRLQDGCLAFLAYLEKCLCFALIVAKDGGDPSCNEQTRG